MIRRLRPLQRSACWQHPRKQATIDTCINMLSGMSANGTMTTISPRRVINPSSIINRSRTSSKPSVTAQLIIIRLPCASSTKSGKMIDGSSVRQKRVGESCLLLRNCTTAFAAISQLGSSFLTLSTICSRCGRMCSMTNSGRPSFAGIRECKPNRRPKLKEGRVAPF